MDRVSSASLFTIRHCVCVFNVQGFIQDFPFGGGNRGGGGGGGISIYESIYEKEGCLMRKRGVGDKSLCQ